jgi:hypothetical protein
LRWAGFDPIRHPGDTGRDRRSYRLSTMRLRHRLRPLRALACCAGSALLLASSALAVTSAPAGSAALPPDAGLPWASPNHDSQLEQLLNPAIEQSIGEKRFLHCEGDYDWGLLRAQKHIPATVWGYVEFYGGAPLDFTELSPQACTYLQKFAQTDPKPTTCTPTQAVFVTKPVTTHRVVRKRVQQNGQWVWKKVRETTHTTRTVQQTVPGSPVPCFTTDGQAAMPEPPSYWQEYANYAMALLTIGHEPFHMTGDTDEARVNCHGLQRIALFAQALGDTPDDAEQIARFAAKYVIPNQPAQYQLPAECRDGGALDLHPDSSVWP